MTGNQEAVICYPSEATSLLDSHNVEAESSLTNTRANQLLSLSCVFRPTVTGCFGRS